MKRSDLFLKYLNSFSIRAQSLRLVPLRLWEPQQRVWEHIADRLDRRKKLWLIILKARRTGMSTLCEGLLLSRVLQEDHVHSLVMGSNAGNTGEIWRMASTMVQHSPWRGYAHLARREITAGRSKLTVATAATPDATRGYDLTCVHNSEVGWWQYPETLLAVMQCLPDNVDTFCFLESTPNGKVGQGKLFYEEWQRAVAEDSDFIPIFLPWHSFPRYQRPGWLFKEDYVPGQSHADFVLDDLGQQQKYGGEEEIELRKALHLTAPQVAWRRWAIGAKCQGNLDRFAQEYPTTPENAFIQSGLPFFRQHELLPFQAHLTRGTKYLVRGGKLTRDPQGYLEVFQEPKAGHLYIVGSDSSFGLEKSDRSRSASQVLDMDTLEQVAEYDAATPPHVQARHLDAIGRYYNMALLCPEVQSAGGGGGREIIVYLKGLNYWNLYIDTARSIDRVKHPLAVVYGWECVDPAAKILTADLQWVYARQLKVGDQVIGCQEVVKGKGIVNQMRRQTVTARTIFVAARIQLKLENDQYTCVSANHPFWIKRPSWSEWRWLTADKVCPGDFVRYLPLWESIRTYEAGRLSGFLDGEGHLARGKDYGFQLLISQAEGPTAQEIRELWKMHGFDSTFKWLRHKKRQREKPIAVSGVIRLPEVLRALGSLRPTRLMSKFETLDFGRLSVKSLEKVAVRSVTPILDGPVVGLTTEPDHTLIADGIVGHNTNSKTRPRMIARLREVIAERSCVIHSARLLSQIANFGESDSGRLEVSEGHDDLLMAFMIALVARTDNWYGKVTSQASASLEGIDTLPGLRIKEAWTPAEAARLHQARVGRPPLVEAGSYLEL